MKLLLSLLLFFSILSPNALEFSKTAVHSNWDISVNDVKEHFEQYRYQETSKPIGDFKSLVFLVDFNDAPNQNKSITSEIAHLHYFGQGQAFGFPYESLKEYYHRSSYGKLAISGEVYGWYRAIKNRSEYESPLELLPELFENYKDTINFQDFDGDGDGVIDNIVIHYTGDADYYSPWWSYVVNTSLPMTNEHLNGMTYQTRTILSGKWFLTENHYNEFMKTLIHEIGHALGLRDYYDRESSNPMFLSNDGTSHYDIMDNNTWDHNGLSKLFLGWIDQPIIITGTETNVELTSFAKEGKVVLVFPYENNLDEFFLVEYLKLEDNFHLMTDRTQFNPGIRIWRINLNDSDLNNSSGSIKMIESVTKGALKEIPEDPFYHNQIHLFREGDILSPHSYPSSYLPYFDKESDVISGKFSGVSIHNIRMINGNALFDIEIDSSIAIEEGSLSIESTNDSYGILKSSHEFYVFNKELKPYVTNGTQLAYVDYYVSDFFATDQNKNEILIDLSTISAQRYPWIFDNHIQLIIPENSIKFYNGSLNTLKSLSINFSNFISVSSDTYLNRSFYQSSRSFDHPDGYAYQIETQESNGLGALSLVKYYTNETQNRINIPVIVEQPWTLLEVNQIGTDLLIKTYNRTLNRSQIFRVNDQGQILSKIEFDLIDSHYEFLVLNESTQYIHYPLSNIMYKINWQQQVLVPTNNYWDYLKLGNHGSFFDVPRIFDLSNGKFAIINQSINDKVIIVDENLVSLSQKNLPGNLHYHNTMKIFRVNDQQIASVTFNVKNPFGTYHFFYNLFDNNFNLLSQKQIYSENHLVSPYENSNIKFNRYLFELKHYNDGFSINTQVNPTPTKHNYSPYSKLLLFDTDFDLVRSQSIRTDGQGTLARIHRFNDNWIFLSNNRKIHVNDYSISNVISEIQTKSFVNKTIAVPNVTYTNGRLVFDNNQYQQPVEYSLNGIDWQMANDFDSFSVSKGSVDLRVYAKYIEENTNELYSSSLPKDIYLAANFAFDLFRFNDPELGEFMGSIEFFVDGRKTSLWETIQEGQELKLTVNPIEGYSIYWDSVSELFLDEAKTTFTRTFDDSWTTVHSISSCASCSPQVKNIVLSQLPNKTHFIQGESLDPVGGKITVTNFDDSLLTLSLTLDMLSGYNPFATVFGPQTVTVSYGGKTTSFQVSLDRFKDVPYGHRNYNHINTLVGLGIINGYSDNTFRPNNTLTRAQAAIMIVRAIGLSTEGVSSNFNDVPSTHSAYKFISAAQNAGIINGYSDGTFRPNAAITRAQIAIMVQRAFQVQPSGTVMNFTDVPVGYAPKSFIETLASQKIVNGYSDGTFKPTNNVTRAQFSTMINNAIEYAQR